MKKRAKIDSKNGNRNIWLLGSSSLFNDIGSDMLTPILPFLVTSLGGGGIAVGALSGLREGLASLVKLLGGWYSDRIGKRMPIVFLGYLLSIIFRFLLALANTWQFVLAFVSIERFGKTRDAPRDAIIAESTKERGRGFGIHQMMDTMGAVLGSILVLFLFWKFGMSFKMLIIIAGSVSVLSLVPLFFVREMKKKPIKRDLFAGVKHLSKKLKYVIFVISIFMLANFGLYMFLLLRVRDITGSIVIAIAFGVLFNLIWAGFSIPFGKLSDKIGRKRVLMIGYVLFLIVALGFIYANAIISLVVLFILYGLVNSITQGNQRALVSDLSGQAKGTAQGFFQFSVGMVTIAGGIIAGFFWNISPATMFIYLSVIALVAIALLAFIREKR